MDPELLRLLAAGSPNVVLAVVGFYICRRMDRMTELLGRLVERELGHAHRRPGD